MSKRALLLLGSGITLISLTAFISKKKEQIEYVVDNIDFKIQSIKNLSLSFKEISMDIGLRIFNPTDEDLFINTGFIKAKVIRVFDKKTNELLALSNLNTSKIDLPSGGSFDLPPVHIEIPPLTGAQYLLTGLSDSEKEKIIDNFYFELDVKALGITKTIKF